MITTRERELRAFVPNWEGKPQEQKAQELASYSLESRGIPDVWLWSLGPDGKLRTEDGRIIEEEKGILREGYPYSLEFQGLLQIQDLIRKKNEGFVAWISPRIPIIYPDDSKIIVSEIIPSEGEKKIFNRLMLFNISPADCVRLARALGENPESPDDLRRNPIFLGSTWINLLLALREITDTSKVEKDIREGKDIEAKRIAVAQSREIVRRDPTLRNVLSLAPSGFFGPLPSGCPPRGAFSALSENAFRLGSFECPNPNCKRRIPSGRGITVCPHCGARKEDYGSKCD